jgi:hypothetical protein
VTQSMHGIRRGVLALFLTVFALTAVRAVNAATVTELPPSGCCSLYQCMFIRWPKAYCGGGMTWDCYSDEVCCIDYMTCFNIGG